MSNIDCYNLFWGSAVIIIKGSIYTLYSLKDFYQVTKDMFSYLEKKTVNTDLLYGWMIVSIQTNRDTKWDFQEDWKGTSMRTF